MVKTSEQIEITLLQQALKDPFARIPSRYQSAYYNHEKNLSLKYIFLVNLAAQAAYFFYAFIDYYVLNDVGMWIIYSKLAYTLSMTAIAWFFYKHYKNIPLFDLLLPYSIAGAAAIWFYNLNLSDSAYTSSYQYTSAVFIVLASLSVQFRFKAALIPNFLIILVTYIGVYFNTREDPYEFFLFSSSYLALAVFSILISWNSTSKSRILFLNQTLTDIHYQTSQRLANTDTLTGLSNRRAFEHIAQHHIEQNKTSAKPMALLVFDVDNFKKINDGYGHDVGDEILKMISKITLQNIRQDDILARFGGEEFIMLLPYTNEQEAYTVAQRIRRSIAEHDFIINEKFIISTSVSIGVARFMPEKHDLRSLTKCADMALYTAKQQGRNRVVMYYSHDVI